MAQSKFDDAKFNTALIVGAGSGLSASLARLLAKEGINVALAARSTGDLAALVNETGAQAFACDATKRAEVAKLFADLDAAIGAPDIVIYNASFRTRGPFVDLDPAEVEHSLATTAFGAFLVAQQAARRMLVKQHGAILFTGASASVKTGRRACSNPMQSRPPTCISSSSPAASGRPRSRCGRGWRNSDRRRAAGALRRPNHAVGTGVCTEIPSHKSLTGPPFPW